MSNHNQEPTRECCEKCRAYARTNEDLTSYVVPTCIDKQCPFCHSIKPPKECCKESCPYLKCHTGRHGVVSTMCTDKCDCSCHSIKPPIATNSQDSYEVKDESKLTSQDLPEEECEVCKMFPEDGHPHEELSPELSWEEKYEELRKNCAGHYDISLPPEVKSFIKKVEQQAVQQYAKEMFYKMKDFEKVHFNSGRASMVEDFKQFIENAPYGVITKTDMDDILQALKNKETKE